MWPDPIQSTEFMQENQKTWEPHNLETVDVVQKPEEDLAYPENAALFSGWQTEQARAFHAQRWDAYAAAGGAPAAGASGFGQQAASGFGQPGQQPGQQSGTPDQSGSQPASPPASQSGPFGSAPEQPGSNRPDAGPSGEGGYGFDPGNK